jgi:hypothetical protein
MQNEIKHKNKFKNSRGEPTFALPFCFVQAPGCFSIPAGGVASFSATPFE